MTGERWWFLSSPENLSEHEAADQVAAFVGALSVDDLAQVGIHGAVAGR